MARNALTYFKPLSQAFIALKKSKRKGIMLDDMEYQLYNVTVFLLPDETILAPEPLVNWSK
jgi:hypothetical protein